MIWRILQIKCGSHFLKKDMDKIKFYIDNGFERVYINSYKINTDTYKSGKAGCGYADSFKNRFDYGFHADVRRNVHVLRHVLCYAQKCISAMLPSIVLGVFSKSKRRLAA